MCRRVSSSNAFDELWSAILHQIPLVRDDDDAAAGAVGLAADRGVLVGRARASRRSPARRRRRRRSPSSRRATLTTSTFPPRPTRPGRRMPGRVDDAEAAAMPRQQRVDRVARRARHVADQHALLPQQPVDQRRLADVRPADDGDARLSSGLRARRSGAAASMLDRCLAVPQPRAPGPQPLHDFIQQLRDPVPVLGGDLDAPARSPAGRTPSPTPAPACRRSC